VQQVQATQLAVERHAGRVAGLGVHLQRHPSPPPIGVHPEPTEQRPQRSQRQIGGLQRPAQAAAAGHRRRREHRTAAARRALHVDPTPVRRQVAVDDQVRQQHPPGGNDQPHLLRAERPPAAGRGDLDLWRGQGGHAGQLQHQLSGAGAQIATRVAHARDILAAHRQGPAVAQTHVALQTAVLELDGWPGRAAARGTGDRRWLARAAADVVSLAGPQVGDLQAADDHRSRGPEAAGPPQADVHLGQAGQRRRLERRCTEHHHVAHPQRTQARPDPADRGPVAGGHGQRPLHRRHGQRPPQQPAAHHQEDGRDPAHQPQPPRRPQTHALE
jgi:hypothetical protein